MINPNKAVEWYKDRYGSTSSVSDYNIYEYLKSKYPNQDYPENPFEKKTEEDIPSEKIDKLMEDMEDLGDKILEIGVSPLWSKERINSFFTDIETN